jgi:hypothetical protein
MKKPRIALGYFNDVLPPSFRHHVYPSPQEDTQMAKTAKKKAAKKKAAKKTTKRPGSAKARVGKGVKTDPTAPLPGMEDLDERVPAIDSILKKIQAADRAVSDAKKEARALTDGLLPLMKKHELEAYKTELGTVCVLHGEDVIVIQKTKKTKKAK